ncbi:257501eb-fa64-42ce-882b-7f534a158960 [Sclerotinia trifoliorum]|uniref:257501eb-fa64-42ce-882b-7f534a158960 n=1 Tax=Sclerotinia trifoliorum TaxID=28548 RepID=A0A8H2ZMV8_9HELO|nr:257501eb-fa64-42ce-882b-7f534a158960 [Sclerotinia trifoliorum]
MASNNLQFGLPSRPNVALSQRRVPRHTQSQEASNSSQMREDSAFIQSRKEPRRTNAEIYQQTNLPRPSIRQPSPVPRTKSETGSRPTMTSRLGSESRFDRGVSSPNPVPAVKGKPSRNVLRRKPSSIAQHAEISRPTTARTATSSPASRGNTPGAKAAPQSSIKPLQPRIETSQQVRKGSSSSIKEVPPRIIPELDRYRTKPEQNREDLNAKFLSNIPYKLTTPDISPPTPSMSAGFLSSGSSHKRYSGYSGSGYSASPSTRFSGSPGLSAYSRDTTPTSMSSVSPSIFVPFKSSIPNRRGSSPIRSQPPLTRRRESDASNELNNAVADSRELPSLRESVNSSSSNSTVKADGESLDKVHKKEKSLSSLPPSPPPRKSSHQFKKLAQEKISSTGASPNPLHTGTTLPPDVSPQRSQAPLLEANNRPSPPRRPSRDGAPDLRSQIGDFAVLQSNFTGVNYKHSKSSSISSQRAASSPLQTSMTLASRETSRNPSPTPLQPIHRDPTPAPTGLGLVPHLRPPSRSHITRTPSPSVDSGRHRFGLFGRRTKTAPEITTAPVEKSQKKGPAAGTGHEGYTRYALRGRSTTRVATGKPRERSLSGAPVSRDQPDTTDPFFRDRMSPVIIAGGGAIKENRNSISEVISRTDSNTSLPPVAKNISQTNLSQKRAKAVLQPSAIPRESNERISTTDVSKSRRPSDSQDDDRSKTPSLAFRRSTQRLNNSTSAINIPKSLDITTKGTSSSISSLDPSLTSGESQLELKNETERGRQVQPVKPKKPEKRARSPRKWNFFHRQAPKVETEIKHDAVPVAIGRQPVKPIPHYAMFEFSDEPEDTDSVDLAEILRDSDVVELTDEQLNELKFSNYKENIRRIEELQTAMAPSLPEMIPATVAFSPLELMMPSSPEVPQTQTEPHVQMEVPIRPSRLQQVGRIPKVVSARPEATSPISFSRPFARLSTIQPTMDLPSFDINSVALGGSPTNFSNPGSYPTLFNSPSSYQGEFLAFSPRSSPRNNSTATTSSSGTINCAEITAIIPEPDAELAEDEVWDEYDDLIETDDNTKQQRVVSTTSSYGVPFQYETYQSPSTRYLDPRLQVSSFSNRELPEIPRRRSAITSISSSCYSVDIDTTTKVEEKDTLNAFTSPTTQVSFSDFLNNLGGLSNSIHSNKSQRLSTAESRKSGSSSDTSRISGASLLRIESEESNSPVSQVNLRVGSMSVSKWLTFGNVLFSPARDEVGNLMDGPTTKCHSILVIDGLGNDDWSFYAAETYPTCTFYNLSPSSPPPAETQNHAYLLPPANHRQIPFSPFATTSKFPFPSSTFSTVIFRFPSSLTTDTYNHILSESRRVLKPGGYIEITLLDLDMLNMGPRTRRAVRGLKTRLKCRDEGVVLGSLGDVVLRGLGARGFGDVKSCRVGIPVAGVLERVKSADEKGKGKEGAGGEKQSEKRQKDIRSLAEMMKDESESADESITRMVAKVGRWWYMRCYEFSLISPASTSTSKKESKKTGKARKEKGKEAKSIFADIKTLDECEKWNTSFKLVVIHAQKPVVVRRRTNSV